MYFLWCKKNVALILIARSSSTHASTKNYPSHILQSNILVTLYILRFRLYNARGMNSLSFPTTHFIAIWRKKHKCMGNVPTFSAVLFFEVEVATDNRHFHSERIEIAKQGKKHKKCARCWGIQKTLVYCRSSPVGDTRMLQSRMLHFFAPEDVLDIKKVHSTFPTTWETLVFP